MALFGSLSTVRAQLATSPLFQIAFDYVAEALKPGSSIHQRIGQVAIGKTERYDLGNGVLALEQAYNTKPPADVRWESHKIMADVQVIVSGTELMEVVDVGLLSIAEDTTPAKDNLFYHPYSPASVLHVTTGGVAIFFPVDAHRPSITAGSPSLIRKTVVKVPVR